MEQKKLAAEYTVEEAIEEFLVYISAVKGYSENTVNSYTEDFKNFTHVVDKSRMIKDIEIGDIYECVEFYSKNHFAPASLNRFLSSVRSLFAYCKKFNYIYKDITIGLKNTRVKPKLPKYMNETEAREMCEIPEKLEILWPARDEALFEMMYSSGCRVSEIASLTFESFYGDYTSAVITGKGSKDRKVFFGKKAVEKLKEYLVERNQRFPRTTDRHIFLNQMGTQLSTRGILYIVKRYSGVEGVNRVISPHTFRHSFATTMLNNGADIRAVQEMLGHSSISTTQKYTHVTKEHLKDVYNDAFPHSGKNKK